MQLPSKVIIQNLVELNAWFTFAGCDHFSDKIRRVQMSRYFFNKQSGLCVCFEHCFSFEHSMRICVRKEGRIDLLEQIRVSFEQSSAVTQNRPMVVT